MNTNRYSDRDDWREALFAKKKLETPDAPPVPTPPVAQIVADVPSEPQGEIVKKRRKRAKTTKIAEGEQEWVSISRVVKEIGLPDTTIRYAIAVKKINYLKKGNRFFVRMSECRQYAKTINKRRNMPKATLEEVRAELQEIKRLLLALHSGGLTDERTV